MRLPNQDFQAVSQRAQILGVDYLSGKLPVVQRPAHHHVDQSVARKFGAVFPRILETETILIASGLKDSLGHHRGRNYAALGKRLLPGEPPMGPRIAGRYSVSERDGEDRS